MASKIAPLKVVPSLPDLPPLCDRCAGAMMDTGELDLSRLRLRGARILVDKVAPVGAASVERVTDHLFAPVQAARSRQTYGIEAYVIAVGPDIDPADISVGDRVIIDEFGGRAIWWGDRRLPYWIVGVGEVMIALGARVDAPASSQSSAPSSAP